MKKIITIIGATSVGKTDLAIRIAEALNGEIIGLDSRQIYNYMPIGTAQPTEHERKCIKHHLIGIRDPWDSISAGEYAKMVIKKVNNIIEKGSVPIICGGAGLYYRAITKGIFSKSHTDIAIRQKLENNYMEDSNSLMLRLKDIDPAYAKIVHINNKKRLIRALEIFELTGISPTEHFVNQKINQSELLNLFTVYLSLEKKNHLNKIIERTNNMLENGWIEEVKNLLLIKKEKEVSIPPLDSIGYKQIIDYLNGDIDKTTLLNSIVVKTRQYARKQSQWFKNENIDLSIDLTNLNNQDIHNHICDIYNFI
tara:strand:+ start:20151 stop:21080 length:930 start_codon:yes stop_codon:yes gene_type:complete